MSQFQNEKTFVIPPQTGRFFVLRKNQFLKVVDPLGQQVSDLFCVDLHDTADALSPGRSIDYNDTIFMTTGDFLYSNRSRKMLEIVRDDCGRHDFLLTPCSLAMFQIVAGDQKYHPSCHENLAKALAEVNLTPDQISGSFNIFMNVVVGEHGRIEIKAPCSKPGDAVVFKACMDLAVALTACSHKETNAGLCKPIHYEIY